MSPYRSASLSRAGGNAINQDRCGTIKGTGGIHAWLVADGLGGHAGGEIAAELAVTAVLDALRQAPAVSPQALTEAIEAAHRQLQARRAENPRFGAMATTLVVLVADPAQAVWAHLGDSRLYRFRDGRLVFQTRDHSVPQVLADAGEIPHRAIRRHEDRAKLLRALDGQPPRPTLLPEPAAVRPGDAFLLCSDGFWDYVTETAMAVDLAKAATPEAWLAAMERRLLGIAPPGHDNYTAIAVWREEE